MQDIILSAPTQESVIHCGAGSFEKYAPALTGKLFVITDSNVKRLYGGLIERTFGGASEYVIAAGERSKTHKTLIAILKKMAEVGLTRSATVVALGGGVVGDVAGLAASLYMRGVKAVQIPTTLLSQVDSSVGGKTAVDFCGIKNLIGAFYQPSEVIVDPLFLTTLPAREIRCGLGEIIKYGALDCGIYATLTQNKSRLSDLQFLESVVADCIRYKAKVVGEDEKDTKGARKALNLGHTTGHAFELYYKRKSHGEFVLIGAYYETRIAVKKGVCESSYAAEFCKLIKKVIKNIPAYDDVRQAAMLAKFDKKNAEQSLISLIVPKTVGECTELILSADEYVSEIEECARTLRGEI